MKQNSKYMYHLTDADNLKNILENGLKPSNTDMMPCSKPNRIYLLNTDERYVACLVATNQLFISPAKKIVRIEIPTKKCNGLRKDIVGEMPSHLGYQWYCKNKVIKPQFFNKIEEFDFSVEEVLESRTRIQKEALSPRLFQAVREQEELWMQMGKPEHIGIQHNTKDGTAELMDLREVELQNPTED